jgi:membrane dipeptidase
MTHGTLRTAATALLGLQISLPAVALAADSNFSARVDRVLAATPLIDAHNDLPWEIRLRFKGNVNSFDLKTDWSTIAPSSDIDPSLTTGVPLQTDIPRLRAGKMGAQFWSVFVPVEIQGFQAVQIAVEQIDLVKRMAARYPADLEMAYSTADILRIHKAGRIASLMGIEGGHMINDSLAVLRQMYDLGARYLILTHFTNTAWADSATDNPVHHGLTPFGKELVREMNRLGMMVDLSHVSPEAMTAALAISEAPVIFSHSSARALVDHPRNVPDDVLRLVGQNGGVVMVNFYPGYDSEARRLWGADRVAEQARIGTPPFAGLYIGQPQRAKAALAAWDREHPKPSGTLDQVADHIDHIRKIAGVDHVGLGSDFDGMEETPVGLEGVNRYPALLAELMRRGWTDEDVGKVAGGNLLRVMKSVEKVAAKLHSKPPSEASLASAH